MLCSAASALERSTPTAPLPALSAYIRHSEDSFLVKKRVTLLYEWPKFRQSFSWRCLGAGSFFTRAVFEVQMSTQASLCDPKPPRSCGGSDAAQRAAPWPAHEESSRWENADC